MPNTQSKWSSVQSCRCNSIATVAMAATSAAAFRTHLLFYTFTSELQICRQFFLLASCCIILLTRIELWRPNITDRYITICHRRCQLFVPRVRCNTLTFGSRAFFSCQTKSLEFTAIILNRIMYALPVYFGYLTESQNTSYNKSATELSVGFVHRITTFSCWQKKPRVRSLSPEVRPTVKIIVFSHYTPNVIVKPRRAMSLRTRGRDCLSQGLFPENQTCQEVAQHVILFSVPVKPPADYSRWDRWEGYYID